jgi:hypothetical protein
VSLHGTLIVMAAASALHITVDARPQVVAAPTGPRPVEHIVVPRDAATDDPGLAQLRAALLAASAARDFAVLASHLGPNVRYPFYDIGGAPQEFIAQVEVRAFASQESFWRNIRDAIRLPIAIDGANRNRAFAPFAGQLQGRVADDVSWPWPKVFVVAEGVRLRVAPRTDAAVIDELSYEVVSTLEDDDCAAPVELDGFSYCWQRVESARGNVGWILNRYAFGKGSFWMELMRYDGRWVIARMY